MKVQTRKDKLVLLQNFLDLETNEIKKNNSENSLYHKILRKKRLDKQIDTCSRCYNLNVRSFTKSVKGFGNINADIFFIGESPCKHSMISQMPFAWASGRILDIILELSGLDRYDVFISNSVHCHLESKRQPTNQEINKCKRILYKEILIVSPTLIVTLGNSAKDAMHVIENSKQPQYKIIHMKHPASFLYNNTGLRDYILKLSLELDKYT